MPQDSRSLVILVCLVVFACVFIVYTAQILPDRVATHFGVGNEADGWMTRSGYVSFMLALSVGMAGLLVFTTGVLPAKFPHWTNVPNRDHWLAPARRRESLGYLAAHGRRLAYLVVMMMLGMHYTILIANQTKPPHLPGPLFTSILISFVLALFWWIVRLYRRFPKPSS